LRSRSRSVEYAAFVEIIHGRWVRVSIDAPSPQGALAAVRRMKLDGKAFIVKSSAAYEFAAKQRKENG
jgi:hypothetical protein